MWLTDNSNGSTIYVFPLTAQLQYTIQVGMTAMPIPLQNIPLLLNFSGGEPTITIEWVITSSANSTGTANGDFVQMTQNVQWGASTQGYTLYLPEISTISSTLTVSVFLTQLQMTAAAGQPNTYTGQATFAIGTII